MRHHFQEVHLAAIAKDHIAGLLLPGARTEPFAIDRHDHIVAWERLAVRRHCHRIGAVEIASDDGVCARWLAANRATGIDRD